MTALKGVAGRAGQPDLPHASPSEPAACWGGYRSVIYVGGLESAFVTEFPLLGSLWSSSKEKVDRHVCKHDPVDVVYNFQKAFDRVPDQKLLRKLNRHGIRG